MATRTVPDFVERDARRKNGSGGEGTYGCLLDDVKQRVLQEASGAPGLRASPVARLPASRVQQKVLDDPHEFVSVGPDQRVAGAVDDDELRPADAIVQHASVVNRYRGIV